MKHELLGRVVGYTMLHVLDHSQVDPGESRLSERTEWGRVYSAHGGVTVVQPIHGENRPRKGVLTNRIHTIMPEQYAHV